MRGHCGSGILKRAGWGGLLFAAGLGTAQAGPTANFGEQGFVTFNYAGQFWAQYQDFTSATDNGSQTDFFLRRNRLTFKGQWSDYIGFYAQLEATSDGRDETMSTGRSIYYRDAYLTMDFSDPLRFIVGKFKNTFTRENLEACLEPLTLDRAETIAYTPFGRSRDVGVAMWGNLLDAQVQYRVMVADGREADEVVQDSPRVTGRIHWSLLDPEYQYGYRGTYLGTQRVLTIGASYDYQADVAYGDAPNLSDSKDYDAWTADIFFEYPFSWGTPTLSGAYMDYSVGDAINMNPDDELPITSELDAYYAKAGYLVPGKVGPGRLQLFYRYENSDYNVDTGFYDQTWNSAGFNYYIDGQRLKFTFEYAMVDFDQPMDGVPPLEDYDQATAGLQLIF
ncbi:short chain amide porin [Thiohalorhabdus denitrificans]|uniref:Short chain amide porin n=2 Tax=Thiohalorhabdus denitrificans TaxID=381306 RepID=A0A1G5APX7_9GAMM|nr:short chain amide porin [Thiohalorhabdus denitrificans]